jgi:hypothetical protein
MKENGVPASIILAVAMHESANGTSLIARYLNNHFGVKGRNSSDQIRSSYRGYESAESSYEDFIAILKKHPQFSRLFDKYTHYDYKNWAWGIQRGGYASDNKWGSSVMATIKKFKLYQYDNRPTDAPEPMLVTTTRKTTSHHKSRHATYKVKRGDTLKAIAYRHGMHVKTLMSMNSLKSSNLDIGQKLKILPE